MASISKDNKHCADCGARNPGWASWNLGIFVCMRCASIHRKLGTHISKVKSLSMDKWNTEQVENMKRNGNTAVNNVYNPKHKTPDIPLDADEVDSAMERFIRKKYQEKSLLHGKPEPPRRDDTSKPLPSISPDNSPPPPLPPKKGRFFGFGLRASSSAYPLSKNDQKKLPQEPRVDSAFPISSDDLGSVTRMTEGQSEMSSSELQIKLGSLRDMGFEDNERNTFLLQKLNGNVERTVEALVQSGQRSGVRDRSKSAINPPISNATNGGAGTTSTATNSIIKPINTSTNPFDQGNGSQSFGLSAVGIQQGQVQQQDTSIRSSTNPFDQQGQIQNSTGIEQTFQNMQVSQQLFPNSTGGYPIQPQLPHDLRMQYSMTPPISMLSQQNNYTNPFPISGVGSNPFQIAQPQQMTGNNPYATQGSGQTSLASSTNPFMNPQSNQLQQTLANPVLQTASSPSTFNPFGIPPSQSPPQIQPQPTNAQYFPTYNVEASPQRAAQLQPTNPFQPINQPQAFPNPQQQTYVSSSVPQNNQYQLQQQIANSQSHQQQSPPNLYNSQLSAQFSQYQTQSQPLLPQQTGRYDKNSILALYNYPQLAPQPLASIPEPSESLSSNNVTQSSTTTNSTLSSPIMPTKRSTSMPVSSMHSAGGNGSRNPFFMNAGQAVNPQNQQQPQAQPGILARHSSRDSVNVNNLENGRHSPDAFANLSARYVG